MSSNQDIADELLRHKVYLLGYSKQLAGEVVLYLKQTEPEVRELILKLFGAGAHRTITRLRDAEVRLRQIRSQAWKRALEYITLRLLEMAEKENEWRAKVLANNMAPLDKAKLPVLLAKTLVAGHTLKELFASLERADGDRAVAQMRIGYLSTDESVTKAMKRLAGPASYLSVSVNNSINTVSATAVVAVVGGVNAALLAANSAAFDSELWVSILDGNTTQGCVAYNGRKFQVGDGPTPGYHYHCRSDRVPYQSDGGSVRTSTYATWIVNQPKDFQQYAGKEFSFTKLKPMKLTQIYRDHTS